MNSLTRRKLLMGNWKMYKTISETRAFAETLGRSLSQFSDTADYAVCPPYTSLQVAKVVFPTRVAVGAQNVHHAAEGAYTGEVSLRMLQEVGVTYVLVGHSERRQYFNETDDACRDKVSAVQAAGLLPVLCVGENDEERTAGRTNEIVSAQTKIGLANADGDGCTVVVAYEPVWAIGTGKTPTAEDAESVIAAIRETIASAKGQTFADNVRILYGGSVKPNNIASFTSQRNIDGALVGGASLDADSFVSMAEAISQQ